MVVDRAGGDEAVQVGDRLGEAPHRDHRPIDRDRVHDGVQPRAVRQAGVYDRARPVDPQAERSDHPLDGSKHRPAVGEPNRGPLESAGALDPDLPGPIDEHVAHLTIAQQGLERAEAHQGVGRVDGDGRRGQRRLLQEEPFRGGDERGTFQGDVGVDEPARQAVDQCHGCSHTSPQARSQRSRRGRAPATSARAVASAIRGRTMDLPGGSVRSPNGW